MDLRLEYFSLLELNTTLWVRFFFERLTVDDDGNSDCFMLTSDGVVGLFVADDANMEGIDIDGGGWF